jgi:outer membrane protein with beta-barrel domain
MHASRKHLGSAALCLIVLGVALPAAAQGTPKAELSAGYNFFRVFEEDLGDEKNFTKGWYADVAGNMSDMLAIVGLVSGTYKTISEGNVDVDLSVHTFLGGVRLSSRANQRMVPFVQFLGGAARSSFEGLGESDSETDGVLQVGGGVNLMPNATVGVRLGGDYLRVFEDPEGVNVFRFTAGVVIPFGR